MDETPAAPPAPPAPPAPVEAAIRGLCPRCGTPGMFATFLRFADRCPRCGLDYREFNVGDGAAAFLIMVVGGLVSLCAIVVELRYSPPTWVHLLLWFPLTLILTIGLLRIAKGLLLAIEYKNAAREGRIAKHD